MRYSVGAAARAAGITEGRLRTWERRYGIPAPARSSTGRRIYEDADIEVIRRMVSLVASGVPAALAAEAVQSGADHPDAEGGVALPPDIDPAVALLVARVLEFDEGSARQVVRDLVERLGWSDACAHALFPVLLRLGEGWERGELSTAHEHFFSELLQSEILAAVVATAEPPEDAPLVLLACAEGELHGLGLAALWLGVKQAGVRTCYLGANVPTDALIRAARETGAAAVCIAATVQTSRPTLAQAAHALARLRPAPRVFVGGPLVDDEPSIGQLAGAPLPASVSGAVTAVTDALSPPGEAGWRRAGG